jgi:hypothetical protein
LQCNPKFERPRSVETAIKTVPLQVSGAEPNVVFAGWDDGETGDFKCLTLSNSSPVLLGSWGFSLSRGRGGEGSASGGMAGALSTASGIRPIRERLNLRRRASRVLGKRQALATGREGAAISCSVLAAHPITPSGRPSQSGRQLQASCSCRDHIGGVTPSRPTRHARPCNVPSGCLTAATAECAMERFLAFAAADLVHLRTPTRYKSSQPYPRDRRPTSSSVS